MTPTHLLSDVGRLYLKIGTAVRHLTGVWPEVEDRPEPHHIDRATRIVLARPELYISTLGREVIIMANIPLASNAVYKYRILTLADDGTPEPAPAADVFSVTSGDSTKLGVAIGAMMDGSPAVVFTPLVRDALGITFEVSDSAGLKVDDGAVDISTAPVPATMIGLDLASPETTSQPLPAT